MRPANARAAWQRLLVIATAVVAIDQISKAIVIGSVNPLQRIDLVPGVHIVHVLNDGVAFGFLGGSRATVLLITLAALALVLGWFSTAPLRQGSWLAIGLLIGGALGNLIDRLNHDAVTDFIDLPIWPAFNLADIAITFGAAALILTAFSPPATEAGVDR